jgi:invasion protein IalB
VTCALTDQSGAKKQCSAVLRIAQTDKNGAQRVFFSWVLGHQDGKLESVFSVPSGVLIQPGVEVKISEKETASSSIRFASPTIANRSCLWTM